MKTLRCIVLNGRALVAVTGLTLAFALVLVVPGCAPTINQATVEPGEPGERLPVSASITKNQTTIQGVELEVRPAAGSYSDAGALTGGGGSYTGQTPRLGPGDYEARVNVRYLRLMLPGEQTKSVTRPFSLGWPAGTFAFHTGGLNGWTYQGVLGASDTFEQCDAATLTSSPHFSATTAGWPTGINEVNPSYPSGAVRVMISSGCYPDQADEVTDDYWQFNLASPNLDQNTDWQGIDGVSFRIRTNVPFGVQAVATVVYEDENGEDDYASPMINNDDVDFTDVAPSDGWVIVEKSGYVPDRPIRRVLIRVFGDPASVAGFEASTVLLDVVSPIHAP